AWTGAHGSADHRRVPPGDRQAVPGRGRGGHVPSRRDRREIRPQPADRRPVDRRGARTEPARRLAVREAQVKTAGWAGSAAWNRTLTRPVTTSLRNLPHTGEGGFRSDAEPQRKADAECTIPMSSRSISAGR